MKAIYSALFLDAASKERLLKAWERHMGPLLPNVHAHHITLQYQPEGWNKSVPYGAFMTVFAEKAYYDGRGGALLVPGLEHISDNDHPHVTVCTDEGIRPFYSNELIANPNTPVRDVNILLSGTIGFWMSDQSIYIPQKHR